jgi:8-oxo-dGTP diphosphatase
VTERDHPTHVLAVSGFVTNDQGDVLLVRVVDRGWELPGGQVELGEGLLDALKREVEEETGCIVEPERLLSIDSRVTPPELLVHVFACHHVSGTPRVRESAVPEVGWFPPATALELVAWSPAADRLRDALVRRDGVRHRTYRMGPYESIAEGQV